MKSKMTTEDLIEDVLLEIFKFLDKDSLISARETCQRWMDVIDDNPGFYKDIKLDIKLNICNKDSLEYYKKLKYQKIRLLRLYPVETVRAILDYHKNHIKDIDFCGSNWSFIVECASKFKRLEKLKFSLNCSPPLDRSIIVNFPELKELTIWFSESANLENFKIIAPKLEKLHIQNKISDENLFGKSLERYPNLKSLRYDRRLFRKNDNQPNELFLNYLATKCENMQELHINANEEELKIILSKTTITHLDTYFYRIRLDSIRLDGIVNTSIKKLSLHVSNHSNYPAVLEEILKSCPNVENVIFKNSIYHTGLLDIVAKFRKVQHITFSSSLYGFQKKKIDLSSILSLSVILPEGYDFANFLSLLLSCKNLKRLKLGFDRVHEIADEFITTVLQKSPKLEEFQTDSNILLSENLVEYLKKGNFKLKKLKIQTNYPVRENLAEIYKAQRALANKLNGESKIKCILLTPEIACDPLTYSLMTFHN